MTAAINVRELDETKLLSPLRYKNYCKENEEYTDWLRVTPDRIIDHIVYTHHAYLNSELPEIGQLLFTLLKTYGKNNQELFEIYLLFSELKVELENHLVKEKKYIFPAMKLYESSKTTENRKQLLEQINKIEGDHKSAGNIIKKIRKITNHFTLPMYPSRTFELAYKKLAEIEKDIFKHKHIIKLFYLKTYEELVVHEGCASSLIYNSFV